ncbi:MAG: DUF5336 domain-containing protein [Pseudonocardiaceae bacterium]
MSAPYGQPPAVPQQPGSPQPRRGRLGLDQILALVAGGLGLVIYLVSFAEGALLIRGFTVAVFVAAGLLAAATVLPKAPAAIVPAAVLSAAGTLWVLSFVVAESDPGGFGTVQTVTTANVIVTILGFLQVAALVVAALMGAGIITTQSGPSPSPQQPSWGRQAGGFPAQPGQYPPGQYGQPGQYPPGQYGQPGQYPPGQYAQPGYYPPGQGGPGQGSPGQGSPGQYGQGQPGQYGAQPSQAGNTTQFEQPGNRRQGDQAGQGQPYDSPGTPPGGTQGPDQN